MGKRQKNWARAARQVILNLLGGECVSCGTIHNLTLDCILPMGLDHHKLDTSARIAWYRQQLQEGNLQILCRRCNAIKSDS